MKKWFIYGIELLIAGVILYNQGLYPFLLFALIVMIWKIDRTTDYFRKLIRCLSITPEIKINAIVKKLDIKDEEIKESLEAAKRIMGEIRWEEIEKEMSELSKL